MGNKVNPEPNQQATQKKAGDGESPLTEIQRTEAANSQKQNQPSTDSTQQRTEHQDQERHNLLPAVTTNQRGIGRGFVTRLWTLCFGNEPERTDVIISIATIVIAVSTIFQAAFAYFQWREMDDAGTQTDKIVVASQKIQSALETANLQNQNALDKTLQRSKEAMDSSNAQTKTALDATIAASKLDQRAWVGTIGVSNALRIEAGNPPYFAAVLKNSGKTPALHVHSVITGKSIPINVPMDFIFQSPHGIFSDFTVQPEGTFMLEDKTGSPLVQEQVDAVKNETVTLYFYGKIDYQDVFGRLHYTTFCYVVANDLKTTQNCKEYNSAD